MDLPISFYVVSAFAVTLTGLSKSGFGGGLGILSVPLMSLFVPPQFALAVLIPVLLVMDILVVWRYRASWRRDVIGLMLPGALMGLAVGAVSFQWMNANVIKTLIGMLALVFVAQFALRSLSDRQAVHPSRPVVFGLGALSGFGSFVAHAGGPPVKGFLLGQNMEKSTFVGTNTMFFFCLNSLKAITYGAMGQLSIDSLQVSLVLAPMLFLGIGLGLWMHRYVDQTMFTRLVYGCLTLTGLRLLWDGAISPWI